MFGSDLVISYGYTYYLGIGYVADFENKAQFVIPRDGKISNFVVKPIENSLMNGGSTITLKINGNATSIVVNVGPGSMDIIPPSNTVNVNQNDLLSIEVSAGGTSGGISLTVSMILE